MTIVFPKNNLPEPSQPWAREVQKQLQNVITSNNSNEINNATRDNQLNSSLITLTGVVADVKTAADEANAAINGLLGLGSTGSEYTINASNINAGTISGDFISGGTITGVVIRTSSFGRRVELDTDRVLFFDQNGNGSGAMLGDNYYDPETFVFKSSILVQSAGDLVLSSAVGFKVFSLGVLQSDSGIRSSNIPDRVLGAQAVAVHATANAGILGVVSSSKDTKQDINIIEIDALKVLSVEPKSFKYNVDVEEYGLENSQTTVGFIAEDLDELGLGHFVRYNNEGKPVAIPYEKYVVALQAVVRNLHERITILENGAN